MRSLQTNKEEMSNGQRWANRMLTDQSYTLKQLEDILEHSKSVGRYTDFERGINKAIKEWKENDQ